MGQHLGRMLICDRCGKTVFEHWHNPWLDEKEKDQSYLHYICFERTDGWVSPDSFDIDKFAYPSSIKTLCPNCEAERKNLMERFWDGK